MKNIVAIALIVSTAYLSGCYVDDDMDPNDDCIESLGSVVSQDRTLSNFSAISLNGLANINLTQGSPQTVEVVTHTELIDRITTTVTNQELEIDMDFCTDDNISQLDVNITVPDISSISIYGLGDVSTTNDIAVDNLALIVEGVGNFNLEGTVENLTIDSEGVGNVNAYDLVSSNCNVIIEGTGNVEITANTTLDVVITGTGNVYYRGNPTITQNVTGTGNVINGN